MKLNDQKRIASGMPQRWAALAIGATIGLGSAPASAAVQVLDFADACGLAVCANGSAVAQAYGDSDAVDVSYRSIFLPDGSTYEPFLKVWGQFGDLFQVVWGGANSLEYRSEITFTPKTGYEVRLLSFDFAQFTDSNISVPISVTSLGGKQIVAGAFNTVPGRLTIDSGFVRDGLRLAWGPDGYNVGLDNIAFEVREIPAGVPEPRTWALLIAGFGAAGVALRRRRFMSPARAG